MKTLLLLALLFSGSIMARAAGPFYVSPYGSDGNAGTGPLSSEAWKSIKKAMRTNASANGTVTYISPGVYRELVVSLSNWTSLTWFIGDPQNTKGFKDGSSVLVPPGYVRVTNFTNTDSTAASTSPTFDRSGKSFIGLANLLIEAGGSAAGVFGSGAVSSNCFLSNCNVQAASYGWSDVSAYGVPQNTTIANCQIFSQNLNAYSMQHTSGAGSDYDMNVVIRDTVLGSVGSFAAGCAKGGTSGGVGGGIYLTNVTFVGSFGWTCGNTSTNTYPTYVRNLATWLYYYPFTMQDTGQVIITDSALFGQASASLKLGTGVHTNDWNPMFDFGASQQFGFGPRPFYAPRVGAAFHGAGGNLTASDSVGFPRPATNSFGAYEPNRGPEHSFSFGQ